MPNIYSSRQLTIDINFKTQIDNSMLACRKYLAFCRSLPKKSP